MVIFTFKIYLKTDFTHKKESRNKKYMHKIMKMISIKKHHMKFVIQTVSMTSSKNFYEKYNLSRK